MAARKTSPKKPAALSRRSKSRKSNADLGEEGELSPAQVRELEKRIQDLEDRTRYMLVSMLGPNFALYYNVSEDSYGWNDPTHATLFKRRKAAQAIQHLLGDRDSLVQCAVSKRGLLVRKSLVLPNPAKKKQPSKRARGR